MFDQFSFSSFVHSAINPGLIRAKFGTGVSLLHICAIKALLSLSQKGTEIQAPYKSSRFYRSVEAILSCAVRQKADILSMKCIAFVLATGQVLFPGKANNEMLKRISGGKANAAEQAEDKGNEQKANRRFGDSMKFI